MQEQEENDDVDGSFFGTVKDMAQSISMSLEDLKSLPKNQLKRQIKNNLDKSMVQVISSTIPQMKKLRFLDPLVTFGRKSYVTQLQGRSCIQALRVRLNMIAVYGNYHGDISMRRTCPHCEETDDTTEHLVECPIFHSTLKPTLLNQMSNTETWKQILEIINFNMDHRLETCSWTRKQAKKK